MVTFFLRNDFKNQLMSASIPTSVLLEALSVLLAHELPWSVRVVHYITSREGFSLFRDILLVGKARWSLFISLYKVLGLGFCVARKFMINIFFS